MADEPHGPKPPAAGTAKLEWLWQGPGTVKATNILYAKSVGFEGDLTSLEALATGMFHTMVTGETSILVVISQDWSLLGVNAIDNTGTTENIAFEGTTTAGQSTNPPLSPNCAMCISWRINAHYRGGHPRTYVPGINSATVSPPGGNSYVSAAIGAMEAFAVEAISYIGGIEGPSAAWALGSVSYYRDHELLETPQFYPYQNAIVGSRVDSQRRRLGKEPPLVS
jgi:hypothetical protein